MYLQIMLMQLARMRLLGPGNTSVACPPTALWRGTTCKTHPSTCPLPRWISMCQDSFRQLVVSLFVVIVLECSSHLLGSQFFMSCHDFDMILSSLKNCGIPAGFPDRIPEAL